MFVFTFSIQLLHLQLIDHHISIYLKPKKVCQVISDVGFRFLIRAITFVSTPQSMTGILKTAVSGVVSTGTHWG